MLTGPPLSLARVDIAATTYQFSDPTGHGWGAICTVNDMTGELAITSDWGSWSYLWSPKQSHLGAATLTHFIGERNGVDYIVDKLLGRRGSSQFCAEATTKKLRGELLERRRSDGRRNDDAGRLKAAIVYLQRTACGL